MPRDFNPRPLAGATVSLSGVFPTSLISIHAPLRGRPRTFGVVGHATGFQSTPPCGGDKASLFSPSVPSFQSTPPCGGDNRGNSKERVTRISIHAPLRGRPTASATDAKAAAFQSTPPCGGDCRFSAFSGQEPYFNPRPLAGATVVVCIPEFGVLISIHAPLRGRPHQSFTVDESG